MTEEVAVVTDEEVGVVVVEGRREFEWVVEAELEATVLELGVATDDVVVEVDVLRTYAPEAAIRTTVKTTARLPARMSKDIRFRARELITPPADSRDWPICLPSDAGNSSPLILLLGRIKAPLA
ncbi:MAG TPA: hypothetical protein VGR56_03970 [Nitrososphaerales archaeon]|nr:hypothetical protein [Nitrososphaerales archaeon]